MNFIQFGYAYCNVDILAIAQHLLMILQLCLIIGERYSCKWKFKFNPEKCVSMTFGKSKENIQVKLGSEYMEEVDCTNYLGTPFYTRPCHEKIEIEKKIESAFKKVWLIKAIGTPRIRINPHAFSKAYWAMVVSKLCWPQW